MSVNCTHQYRSRKATPQQFQLHLSPVHTRQMFKHHFCLSDHNSTTLSQLLVLCQNFQSGLCSVHIFQEQLQHEETHCN